MKNINIRATYFHINPFEDLEIDEYDKLELREGKYIIYKYSYGDLFCESDKFGYWPCSTFMGCCFRERTIDI